MLLTPPEHLPGRRHTCAYCGAVIVFARTLASPTGAGGKPMPLDLAPNKDGNVAVRVTGNRARPNLVARVLGKDEGHDRHTEIRAMPHFATCGRRKLAKEVEAFLRDVAEGGAS